MGEYNYKLMSWVALSRGKNFLSLAEELEERNPCPVILTVVNASFACEIMLKSIIYFAQGSTKRIGTHNLKDLFDKIDEKSKKIIEADAGIEDWERFWLDISNALSVWHGYEKTRYLYIDFAKVLNFAYAIKNHTERMFKELDLFADERYEM